MIFDKKLNKTSECMAVTAAAVLIKKSIYKKLNGLSNDFFYGYEDVDFMLNLNQKGYKISEDTITVEGAKEEILRIIRSKNNA